MVTNKLNIGDVVKVVRPGFIDDGVQGPVTGIQLWTDGTILYDLKYHVNCPEGGEGYDSASQIKDGEYEIVSRVGKVGK